VAHEPDLAQGALPLQVARLGVVEYDLLDRHRLVRLVRRLVVPRRTVPAGAPKNKKTKKYKNATISFI
jgi:hypothetical protein